MYQCKTHSPDLCLQNVFVLTQKILQLAKEEASGNWSHQTTNHAHYFLLSRGFPATAYHLFTFVLRFNSPVVLSFYSVECLTKNYYLVG